MEKKINKIMACIDFSEYTQLVLTYAMELAKELDLQIVAYNVINQRDVNMVGMVSKYAPDKLSAKSYVEGLFNEREKLFETLINDHFTADRQRISFQIEVGMPNEMILKKIEAESIDLVVMANKGRGNLDRVLFGSVAEKVFRHSPVPVVSVRDLKKFKRE